MVPSATDLVVWTPDYRTRVQRIDDQHKSLIDIIRSFQEAMLEGRARVILSPILQKLRIYTQVHFAEEQHLMERHDYPDRSTHKAVHTRLVERISELQTKLDSCKPIPSVDVMIFMRHWLTDHIVAMDKPLGKYLARRGVE